MKEPVFGHWLIIVIRYIINLFFIFFGCLLFFSGFYIDFKLLSSIPSSSLLDTNTIVYFIILGINTVIFSGLGLCIVLFFGLNLWYTMEIMVSNDAIVVKERYILYTYQRSFPKNQAFMTYKVTRMHSKYGSSYTRSGYQYKIRLLLHCSPKDVCVVDSWPGFVRPEKLIENAQHLLDRHIPLRTPFPDPKNY